MKISSNALRIALIAFIFTSLPSHVFCADIMQIEYNPVTDSLTVKAQDVKLEEILSYVSHKTGIFIRIDPSIEKRVTIDLSDAPFESVLRKLSRGLSHSMIYESQNNGDGPRLIGIEILRNDSAYGIGSRSYSHTNTQFLSDHGLNDNGSPQPDPHIYNHYTVDHAGIGSLPDTAAEQSFDMATTEFTPVSEDAVAAKNAWVKNPVDSSTETPGYTSNERIVPPMKVTITTGFARRN